MTKTLKMGQNGLELDATTLIKTKKNAVFKGLVESMMMAEESSLEKKQSCWQSLFFVSQVGKNQQSRVDPGIRLKKETQFTFLYTIWEL